MGYPHPETASYSSGNTASVTARTDILLDSPPAQQRRLHLGLRGVIDADLSAKILKNVAVVARHLIERSVQIVAMRGEQHMAYVVGHGQQWMIAGGCAPLRLVLPESEFQDVARIRQ